MLSYEEIYKVVEKKLSEKRFYHSKCVVERCIEYAKIYGVDVDKMKIAGIVHDIAKEMKLEESLELAEEYKVQLDEVEKNHNPLIHAKLGAEIAKIDFGCTEDICESIKWHTTGKENMSLMEKILFIADATSADRKYEDTEKIYSMAKENLDKAIFLVLKECIIDVIEKDLPIHLDSIKAYNSMI